MKRKANKKPASGLKSPAKLDDLKEKDGVCKKLGKTSAQSGDSAHTSNDSCSHRLVRRVLYQYVSAFHPLGVCEIRIP
jgi:hypothetical protein